MKIAILFLLFVGWSRALDEAEKEFAKDFLEKYEYVDYARSNFAEPDDVMSIAIANMQEFAGLKITGKLNKKTLKKMHSKRCGVRDHDVLGLYAGSWPTKDLTYRFENHSPDLGKAKTESIIKAALQVWADVTPLTFTEIPKNDARGNANNANIDILFQGGYHGSCPYPFDGRGGVLAHAFFPTNGDSHFDEAETFTDNTYQGTNLFWVAAHEFGHALGLSHSNVRSALMYPYYTGYNPNFKLPQDDTYRIRSLYGANTNPQTPNPNPTAAPTAAPTAPRTDAPLTATPSCKDIRRVPFCANNKDAHCEDDYKSWYNYMTKYCARTCNRC